MSEGWTNVEARYRERWCDTGRCLGRSVTRSMDLRVPQFCQSCMAKRARGALGIAILIALTGCSAFGEAEQAARGITERYACTAELQCERTPIGPVIDGLECAAGDVAAHDETMRACDKLAAVECSGSRYWRCAVTCEPTANPAPCVP